MIEKKKSEKMMAASDRCEDTESHSCLGNVGTEDVRVMFDAQARPRLKIGGKFSLLILRKKNWGFLPPGLMSGSCPKRQE